MSFLFSLVLYENTKYIFLFAYLFAFVYFSVVKKHWVRPYLCTILLTLLPSLMQEITKKNQSDPLLMLLHIKRDISKVDVIFQVTINLRVLMRVTN